MALQSVIELYTRSSIAQKRIDADYFTNNSDEGDFGSTNVELESIFQRYIRHRIDQLVLDTHPNRRLRILEELTHS